MIYYCYFIFWHEYILFTKILENKYWQGLSIFYKDKRKYNRKVKKAWKEDRKRTKDKKIKKYRKKKIKK